MSIPTANVMLSKTDANLSKLSPELLIKITEQLEIAQSIARLATTCKSLRNFVNLYAWKAFTKSRFPTMNIDSSHDSISSISWRDLAQTLTRHSMVWERKAFNAFALDPSLRLLENDEAILWGLKSSQNGSTEAPNEVELNAKIESLTRRIQQRKREFRWRNNNGSARPYSDNRRSIRSQTIGSHTRIDCKVDFTGSTNDSQELLVIGAGADLHVRLKKNSSRGGLNNEIFSSFQGIDAPEIFRQGRDDITTVKVASWHGIDKSANDTSPSCEIVVGRISGSLQKLDIDLKRPLSQVRKVTNFCSSSVLGSEVSENSTCITSADVHKNLLAASARRSVMLYDITSTDAYTAPVSELSTVASQHTWCTSFLSANRIAVGVGRCLEPLQIYDINETGLVSNSSFHVSFPTNTSVYAIQPLHATSTMAGSVPGNIFLTGSHDGWCRLMDLRDPHGIVSDYQDHIENFPCYSLALVGQERFIAGSSQESRLTVYDLRMGNKAYHYTDALPCLPRSPFPNPPEAPVVSKNPSAACLQNTTSSAFLKCRFHEEARKRAYDPNFRLDLGPKEKWKSSPIYSLCSSSHLYPHIYAGVHDHVLDLRLDGGSKANVGNRQETLRVPRTNKKRLTYPFKEDQFFLGMTEIPEEASAQAYVPLQRGLDMSPICIPDAFQGFDQEAQNMHRLDLQWHLEKDHWNHQK